MSKKLMNLSEVSDDQMVDIMSMEVLGVGSPSEKPKALVAPSAVPAQSGSAVLKTRLSQYIGLLRGMQLWYHAAHHVTRGASFFADHTDAYGKLYSELSADFDAAVEKAIGLTSDEEMANPCKITEMALQVLHKFPCPPTLTALALASTALEIEKAHNELVTAMFHELESANCLSLGLDDMLMATVNAHEGHIYMLQQRVKTELEN